MTSCLFSMFATCRRRKAGWQWTELHGKIWDQLQWILGHRVP